ncbi:DUF1826 domain-containing protein [Alteromonas oceanisediminis]|uniref:DUF1826 domain-containing protein n=1 Tax=Alteromonas oceanisediminis TaxID=2836180 RepID=UPI001BDA45C1|nr:DUF1826 domain-containing protein [Alteromonas oceanisediminis]MBT0585954.1 DUF1826 domain-containing protein [Alteromonas oceanisediminis]
MTLSPACQVEQTPMNTRYSARSEDIEILTAVYQPEINMAIWQRALSVDVKNAVQQLLLNTQHLNTSSFIRSDRIESDVRDAFRSIQPHDALLNDVVEVVDIFRTLFELSRVGLRMRILDKPMCPRFHVDRVPCRLVSTYSGRGTQWLDHADVRREKLGLGSGGLAETQDTDVGDIALLKGESWFDNELGGVVHRSPPSDGGQRRLIMTVDFLAD